MIDRPLNIGIVSPYGWDAPGGVQAHISDLRDYLVKHGHKVSVLAPSGDEESLPDWVVNAGRPISIPYNGAVARVLFGPIAFARVKQWISENEFDLLHLHEPAIPSISLLACWAAEGPMVGTFHASAKRQKASFAIVPILEPVIEKLSARIAVSEAARETLRAQIREISGWTERQRLTLCVDGGVNEHNIGGLDVELAVSASSVLSSANPQRQILRLQTSSAYEAP